MKDSKLKSLVLDSFALIAFFKKERVAPKVRSLLTKAKNSQLKLYFNIINLGEVFYILSRYFGKENAQKALAMIDSMPINLIGIDKEFVLRAAEIKSSSKISYADSFAAATALNLKIPLATGDKEFKEIEHLIKIIWL